MLKKIEVSHKTIIFTVLFILSLWLLYIIREVILQFFVALLIMTILNPLVTRLSKYRIPRGLSILLVYFFLIGLISFTFATIIPPLIEQTTLFINNFPKITDKLGFSSSLSEQLVEQVIIQVGTLPAKIGKLTVSIFSNILSVVAVLVFAFYLLSERGGLDKQMGIFLDESKHKELGRILDLLEGKLGSWAIGQMSLMFVVGLFSYVGLSLLGIPFSLPLAILAGLLEIIPYLGPIVAAIPAVIIGFGISPFLGFAAIALAFLVQQLENYVFVPKIMQKSTGVNPIVTLLALSIGFKLAGIVGLLISIPVFITLTILGNEYLTSRNS